MPESINNCGEPMAPADKIISFLALITFGDEF